MLPGWDYAIQLRGCDTPRLGLVYVNVPKIVIF